MQIKAYQNTDCAETLQLFTNTVRNVNAADYTPQQIEAWLAGTGDTTRWNSSLLGHYALVAVAQGRIIGFGDIDCTGYLDRLFVHHLLGRRGVATALADKLEQVACQQGALQATTHVSITAKPFFLNSAAMLPYRPSRWCGKASHYKIM